MHTTENGSAKPFTGLCNESCNSIAKDLSKEQLNGERQIIIVRWHPEEVVGNGDEHAHALETSVVRGSRAYIAPDFVGQ